MLRAGKWLIGFGVGFLVAALLWLVFAVPALVRYPLTIDATPVYEGTFTLFVDPQTFAPLPEPRKLPLKVTRHIDALGSKSSWSKVVVSEKIDFNAGDGQFTQSQDNQYVMDRRSIENVQDDRAYAFTPTNVVNRSPAFRLNFPFDTDGDQDYLVYKNEIGATYTAHPDPVNPNVELDGLHLIAFVASDGPLPITQAYIDLLSKTVPLPASLTITQLTPLLLSVGIDVPGTLAALGPVISPEDLQTLTSLAAKPVELVYLDTFSGTDAVEPTTGAVVAIRDLVETVSATASPDALPPIIDVLSRYPQVPEAQKALEGLNTLGKSPIPLFRNEFSQTDASVKDIAGQVKDQKDKITLVKKTVPLAFTVLGVVAGVAGLVFVFLGSRRRGVNV
ncbi:MAG TPA: porin PorA family protein [Acidimicrobiales bacterium]|nr:porin PorA family protein [Acidimicrobiales bacterium]